MLGANDTWFYVFISQRTYQTQFLTPEYYFISHKTIIHSVRIC